MRSKPWLHYWTWRFHFEPRDLWIGVYWKRYPQALEVFLCLLPTLPLIFYVQWHNRGERNL